MDKQIVIINKDNIVSEIDVEKKKKLLKKRFSITNETINVDDIYSVMEMLQLADSQKTKEKAQNIFNVLDVDKKGEIKTEEFIENITSGKLKESETEDYKMFVELINKQLVTRSEKIIEKLKKIKKKAWTVHDKETCDDIDWIIKALSDDDIHELDYIKQIDDNKTGNAFDYIVKYSHMEDTKRREKDIRLINYRNSIKPMFLLNNETLVKETTNETIRDTSTRRSSFISPSILGKLNTQLMNISKFEFNIFELNEIVEKKSTYYIAYEIFSKMDFLDNGMVKENNFKNFVNSILLGYDRNNAYHNDLHAGDVMQTVYAILENGNLKDVRIFKIFDLILKYFLNQEYFCLSYILITQLIYDSFFHPLPFKKNSLFVLNC
jgi:Ca2+-binding EF-hand superfamily protein